MSALACSAVVVPLRNAAEGSQNTDRPIAKPTAVGLAAAAANQRSIVPRSAALPRMICRQAGCAAIAASIVRAPSGASVPFDFPECRRQPAAIRVGDEAGEHRRAP